MRSAGIIGLGLMGGSLARDLAAAGWRVLGDDRDAATLAAALASGVVAGPLGEADLDDLDLLVLAVPVRAAADRLRWLAANVDPGSGVVVTDVGSTKRSVVAAAEAMGLAGRFVGSHPVAGSHESGWDAGRAGLFRGRTVWLCPPGDGGADAMRVVEALWRSVGGDPKRLDADAHDRLLAAVSHLPQLAATSLAAVLDHQGVAPGDLGPGGRDTTRLAGSDPDMWTDIVVDNADAIVPVLESLVRELDALTRLVRQGDAAAVRSRLERARAWSLGT